MSEYPFTVSAKPTEDDHERLSHIARRWDCTRSEVVRRLIRDIRETEIYLGTSNRLRRESSCPERSPL